MKRVSIFHSLDALPEHYEDIFSGSGSTGFFSSLAWFRHFAGTVLSSNKRVRIYGVEAESSAPSPSMVLPMHHEVSALGKLAPRKLTALGNYYTPLFSLITAGPNQPAQEDLNLLAAAIAAERPKWDIVDLRPLQTEDALFDGMMAAFRNTGMMAERYFCFSNWYLEVNNRSYREYHDSLPSRLRNTIRRKTERLANAGRLRVEIITQNDHLGTAIAAYEQVYTSSWKKPEPYPQFIPGLIRTCADRGWLRLGLAYIDDIPAAAQVWIVCDGVSSIYKLAYDERFSADSIGSILTARLMEHVIDIDRVRQVDFLSGDDSYKQDWMSHRRERHGIIAWNLRTTFGLLGALRHLGGKLRKRFASVGGQALEGNRNSASSR